jgi:ATP-dependent RNA helicase RhlB
MTFEQLQLRPELLRGIRDMEFTELTLVQEKTLAFSLTGRDVAVQSQTGTGKTAAFLITIFQRQLAVAAAWRKALIIAPTRELAVQIEAEAKLIGRYLNLKIGCFYGGVGYNRQEALLKRGVDIMVGTPGRLLDLESKGTLSMKNIGFLVIDEADRLFDMGFISDLRFLLRRMSPYDKRQSMLFSATLSNRVLELCYEHMNNPERFSVTPENITVEQIEQEIYHIGMSEKFGLLLGILRREPGGRYLIFCNTKAAAERLEVLLNANGFAAAAITGDLPQKQRLKVLSRFRDGTLPILAATDVASRGLHIEAVTHVINYDLPQDSEDYVHRIGRTARAGAAGRAISLACEEYVHSLPDIEDYIRQKIPVMPLTEEMIVTGYRKARGYAREKSPQPQRKEFRELRRKEKPLRTGNASRGSEKAGRFRPERKKPLTSP